MVNPAREAMRRRARGGRDRDGGGDVRREAGMSALEVVLLAPLVIGFIMMLVVFGVLVNARGNVQGAARDAARMGSLQRDYRTAQRTAQSTAASELAKTCPGATAEQVNPANVALPDNDFTAGGLFTIKVVCTIPLSGLDWFSLGSKTVTAYSTAPLDTFRRTG
jgi:Flp pilus assembly protein TadG